MKYTLTDKAVFNQLLASLPEEYTTVRDAIDGQGLTIDDIELALERLEIKEDSLAKSNTPDEEAHMARDRRYAKGSQLKKKSGFARGRDRSRRQRSKSRSESDSPEPRKHSNARCRRSCHIGLSVNLQK
jgi:hypothetical protein